jgi:hypothetical protein
MRTLRGIAALLLIVVTSGLSQSAPAASPKINGDITGLYSFVHEGEFVQIEVDENGKVTGLVSRFKDDDPEKAEFVDQFFDQAKLEGTALSFRTKAAGGTQFEFSGTVERGHAKTSADEGYWSVKGVLIERRTGADGKVSENAHELTLKSFPEDMEPSVKPTDKKE